MVVIKAVFLTYLIFRFGFLEWCRVFSMFRTWSSCCSVMVVLLARVHFQTLCCAVWAQQLLLPVSLLAVLLAGWVLLLTLHSLSHSVVEVVVARFDHLGNLLEEGVMSEVVGMAILHGSPALPARCDGLEKAQGKRSDHEIIYFETFLSRMSFCPGRIG